MRSVDDVKRLPGVHTGTRFKWPAEFAQSMNLDGGGSGYDDLSSISRTRWNRDSTSMQYEDDLQPGAAHLVLP